MPYSCWTMTTSDALSRAAASDLPSTLPGRRSPTTIVPGPGVAGPAGTRSSTRIDPRVRRSGFGDRRGQCRGEGRETAPGRGIGAEESEADHGGGPIWNPDPVVASGGSRDVCRTAPPVGPHHWSPVAPAHRTLSGLYGTRLGAHRHWVSIRGFAATRPAEPGLRDQAAMPRASSEFSTIVRPSMPGSLAMCESMSRTSLRPSGPANRSAHHVGDLLFGSRSPSRPEPRTCSGRTARSPGPSCS